MSVDLPLPVIVTRHQCPHCRRTWAKQKAAAAHIGRCWKNPAVQSCKGCGLYEPATYGEPCFPGRWCDCNSEPERCLAGVDLPARESMPITGCARWEPPTESPAA